MNLTQASVGELVRLTNTASCMDMTHGHPLWLPAGTILEIYTTFPSITATIKSSGQLLNYSVQFGIHDYPGKVEITRALTKDIEQ